MTTSETIRDALARALPEFALIQAFRVETYNTAVAQQYQLPGAPEQLAVLVGNTRSLWPAFIAYLRRDPARAAAPDPLDDYVETRLRAAQAAIEPESVLVFGHHRGVDMVQVARLSGAAFCAPNGLAVHPLFGPWIALRAVFIFEVPGPRTAALESTCPACTCGPLFDALIAEPTAKDAAAVAKNADRWIASRAACPLGRAFQYGPEQLRYHYLGDREAFPPRTET